MPYLAKAFFSQRFTNQNLTNQISSLAGKQGMLLAVIYEWLSNTWLNVCRDFIRIFLSRCKAFSLPFFYFFSSKFYGIVIILFIKTSEPTKFDIFLVH